MSWVKVAEVSELEDGDVIGVDASGLKLAVYRENEDYFVTGNICSHQYALLSEGFFDDEEGVIECPLHQAQFDVRTGKVCDGPAETDIPTYPVQVEAGEIFAEVN